MEARKELAKFAKVTIKMSDFAHKLIAKKDDKSRKKMMDKMKKYEAISDRMEIEISKFYEKLPKPVSIALDEFMDDKVYNKLPEQE